MSADPPKWTAKGLATRGRILNTAAGLMHQRGVAGTAMPDVLRAASVSNSQLYHYFSDKDDLTRAVIDHQIDRIVGANETTLAALDSFAALDAWRDAIVTAAAEHAIHGGCPLGSLASQLAESDELARLALAAGFERWERALRDGLAAMRTRGLLRADADPDHLALATLAALQGGLLLTQTRRDIAPVQAALDGALGYIHGFAAPDPRDPS